MAATRVTGGLGGLNDDKHRPAVKAKCRTGTVISRSVRGSIRELYGFELEPEVRDWLDSLSDSDYKRADEVCGLLAEKGTGPPRPRDRDLRKAGVR